MNYIIIQMQSQELKLKNVNKLKRKNVEFN